MTPEDAPTFIEECHRLLKPEGVLRVAVPDLEQICRLYLLKLQNAIGKEPNADEEYDWLVIELLDQCVRERSGGEMIRYLRRKPLTAVDFVIERIGNEGRQMLAQIGAEAERPLERRQRVSLRAQLRVFRLWLAKQLLGPGIPRELEIGQFRVAGEVHQWMYDRFSLARLLTTTGFVAPQVVSPYSSRIPGWETFHLEADEDGSVHKPDSLVMEFLKPL